MDVKGLDMLRRAIIAAYGALFHSFLWASDNGWAAPLLSTNCLQLLEVTVLFECNASVGVWRVESCANKA